MTRQCPECELRFASESELREHLDNDHPGTVGPPRTQPHPQSPEWPR